MTPVQELEREQARSLPKDDLKPYAGQWVALRDGHVIAAALDAVALRSHPEVRSTDTFVSVPDSDAGIFIL